MRTQRLHADVYTTLAGVVGPLRNDANEAKLLRCIHTTKGILARSDGGAFWSGEQENFDF
ncbi:hypothetical protein Tco_1287603, partial [Tanacetum coccineum]